MNQEQKSDNDEDMVHGGGGKSNLNFNANQKSILGKSVLFKPVCLKGEHLVKMNFFVSDLKIEFHMVNVPVMSVHGYSC